MIKKYSRIIAVIMLVIAIVFIFIALNNPQASFPWSNEITYILYGVYVCLRGRKIFCVYGKNSSLIRNRYV